MLEVPGMQTSPDGSRSIDGVQLVYDFGLRPAADRFPVLKDQDGMERYLELLARHGRDGRVVELGIYQGGSVALAALAFPFERLLALDISTDRIDPLDELLAVRQLDDRIRCRYGVDQGDREQLTRVVAEELGDEPLHLVIDDASHALDLTRASFDVLFPRLGPGGRYAIEDWSWDHAAGAWLDSSVAADPELQERIARAMAESGFVPPQPLTRLAVELLVAVAIAPTVVASVELDPSFAVAERGPAELAPDAFHLHDHLPGTSDLLEVHLPESAWDEALGRPPRIVAPVVVGPTPTADRLPRAAVLDGRRPVEDVRAALDATFGALAPGDRLVLEHWAHELDPSAGTDRATMAMGDASSQLRSALEAPRGDPAELRALAEHLVASMAPPTVAHLVVELVLAVAAGHPAVRSVRLEPGRCVATRGPAELDPGGFALRDLFVDRFGEARPQPNPTEDAS